MDAPVTEARLRSDFLFSLGIVYLFCNVRSESKFWHRSNIIIKSAILRKVDLSFSGDCCIRVLNPHPPLSPNSLAQSSNSCKPCLLTLGRMFIKLASKSSNWMGRISSVDMYKSASPKLRSGPIAASFARAVISLPEKPCLGVSRGTEGKWRKWGIYHLSALPRPEYPSWIDYVSDAPKVFSAALLLQVLQVRVCIASSQISV